jgi:calcium/calmodulin-dependent protein kinase I|uniref:Protein kinase domain-containing protein n=1 Tax=Calcidiscus leptoporus TaxID=127549 RepID=A0A6U5DNC8_9EUKA|mmetsp:Transcript_15321/g.35263  ORF Transcript_15321/g.35263 Transcript_15321/m.35263 type:complete len:347 (+) Transcript_15321:103-1143(+)|eukprot:CAMPEP_0119362858 /NCGR_PEP_ID=MMETSP1334-20130426/9771_1 /TAXON_ID=127549 /ORGANISM="Calcidiscus leptoporus, Strain RCC1130" /LENGTH=346 /DNA_ID=CAMNT_0007378121 /DNA_START=102 /DNA_END=1142 /DNA_ORIENTATION=+
MAGLDGVNVELETQARIKALADVTVRDIKERYKMGSELGRGRFSVVFDAAHLAENASYAVKEVKNESLHDEENLEALETEINILRQLQHPHIVTLKEVVATSTYTYIVMELLSGGELFNRIVEKSCFPESDAKPLFAQIMLSMEYLHSLNIVHRDVKPENILYICPGGNDIKLIDFGYAGVWATDKPLTGLCGTPDYVAPEVLTWYEDEDQGTPYGKGSDMWSLGVLLYVILSGCSPFSGDDEEQLLKLVQEAKYEFYENEWQGISENAKDLIRKLLVVDPTQRLTMEEVISHPWLAETVGKCRAEMATKTTKKMSRVGSNGAVPPAGITAQSQSEPRTGCACAIL